VPALPSWLTDPLWGQFAALLPARETYVSTHPWGGSITAHCPSLVSDGYRRGRCSTSATVDHNGTKVT
jgi:hypothetical protein